MPLDGTATVSDDMANIGPREAYGTPRAAALAGVPVRTVYHWAKIGTYVPSVSPTRVRLYSLTDIVALRAIYWLRSPKEWVGTEEEGEYLIPPTKMREVRRVIAEKMSGSFDLSEHSLLVDLSGKIFLERRGNLETVGRQVAAGPIVRDVLREFQTTVGTRGPDLAAPRPLLRIISGKLGGEPHVLGTRLRTLDVDGLIQAGYTDEQVVELYPFLQREHIAQAASLEAQLRGNLEVAAA